MKFWKRKKVDGPIMLDSWMPGQTASGAGIIVIGVHARCPNSTPQVPGLLIMACEHEVFDLACHCTDCGMVMHINPAMAGDRADFTSWALELVSHHGEGSANEYEQ